MAHVARLGRRMDHLGIDPKLLFEKRNQAIECDTLAATDVTHRAGRIGRFERQKIGLDNVVYKREVTRLLAVAMDRDRLVGQQARDEFWNNCGILRVGILLGTEDIEIPQADRLYTV